MKNIRVELDSNSYEILIGSGLLARSGHFLREAGFSGRLVIITDPTVKRLHGEALTGGLVKEGFSASVLLVPEGEEQKSLERAGKLYSELTGVNAERGTPVLAFGGGVIGDLAGFVAATYLRGVPFIQVPTTLLAQVDSSIGGKVAIDHGQLKNRIGVFYQPRLVIADIATLKTLPESELANGLAEVIKSAAIRDAEFFAFLEKNIEKIKSLDEDVLEETAFRTASIKAEIVEKDERDLGLRNILNYGHTIGHAIESTTNFSVPHGKAVALGMIAAARLSNKMGTLGKGELKRLQNLIEKAGLLTGIPEFDMERIIQAVRHDKKVLKEKIRFVLLEKLGKAFIIDEVAPDIIQQVLVDR